MLYPIELRGRGEKERTVELRSTGQPVRLPSGQARRLSLHGRGRRKNWGGKRESNPQPSEPQSGALPVELFPPQPSDYSKRISMADRRAGFFQLSEDVAASELIVPAFALACCFRTDCAGLRPGLDSRGGCRYARAMPWLAVSERIASAFALAYWVRTDCAGLRPGLDSRGGCRYVAMALRDSSGVV
jgi:hypothetical protein